MSVDFQNPKLINYNLICVCSRLMTDQFLSSVPKKTIVENATRKIYSHFLYSL